jgi:GNAT superfamily N-acetyltransferase
MFTQAHFSRRVPVAPDELPGLLSSLLLDRESPEIAIRALSAADAIPFRNLALEALNRDGRFFAADLATEASRTEREWAAMCEEDAGQAVFGGFVDGKLAGMMAARRWSGDPTGRTVRWGAAYVKPAHRRVGVGLFLFGTREQWSQQRGFATAVMAIREDNARAIEIHTDNGAVRFNGEVMSYADGTRAPAHWFRKALNNRR